MDADSLLQCPESTFPGTAAIFALAAYSSTEGDLPVYSTQETTASFLGASQGGYSMDPTLKIHMPIYSISSALADITNTSLSHWA